MMANSWCRSARGTYWCLMVFPAEKSGKAVRIGLQWPRRFAEKEA
jgi:hypothetical protein